MRKAFFSNPISTKAAFRPSSRFRTLPFEDVCPLIVLPCVRSILNSSRLAFFGNRYPRFENFGVYETSLWIFLTGLMSRWTFFTSVVAAARIISTMHLGRFLESNRGKGFSS